MLKRADTPIPKVKSPVRRLLRRLLRLTLAAALLVGGYWVWNTYPSEVRQVATEAQRLWAPLWSSLSRIGQPAAAPAPQAKPAPVRVAIVERKDFPIVLTGLGTVQATNTVTVRSRVDGQIVKVGFEEGQMLKEGDLLAQIDPAPFKAALDQAMAKLLQDEASLKMAKQDLERTIPLARQGVSSQQLLDQRTANVANLTALIEADKAAIDSAKVQLNYTTITSPLTGRAGFRLVDPGNIVHAADQTGILTITQLQPISVVFTAPELQLPDINAALKSGPLQVTAFSSDGRRRLGDGNLKLVDNQVDPASGTIRLKATFPNQDNALWPGLSVTTRLLVDTVKNGVVVPDSAVQRGPNGLYAYVVTGNGKAELRDLKVDRIADGLALVEKGLAPGERIITSGHYRVQPGGAVEVISGPDTPESASAPAYAPAQPMVQPPTQPSPSPPPRAEEPPKASSKPSPSRKVPRP